MQLVLAVIKVLLEVICSQKKYRYKECEKLGLELGFLSKNTLFTRVSLCQRAQLLLRRANTLFSEQTFIVSSLCFILLKQDSNIFAY